MADDDFPPELPDLPSPPDLPSVPTVGGLVSSLLSPPAPPLPPASPAVSSSAAKPGSRATAQSGAGGGVPDPVGELRFQVTLGSVTIGQFAECSGLSVEYDIFEYAEGGESRFVHKFRGGLKFPNLVLKRGVTYEDALLKWFLDQQTDRDKGRPDVTLSLLGDDGQQVRMWALANAFPVKWQGPSFSARSTNIATETLEIAHQGFQTTS